MLEAQVVVEAWRVEYNDYRPIHPSVVSLLSGASRVGSSPNQRSLRSWTIYRDPLTAARVMHSIARVLLAVLATCRG